MAQGYEDVKGLGIDELDEILGLQLLVAWAGEGQTDPPRLGYFRTSLVDEYGGLDLFERLLPHTYPWAVFGALREAARRVDARSRESTADADQLISLYHFGFELDERLDERFAELRGSGGKPEHVLSSLRITSDGWDAAAFKAVLGPFRGGEHTVTPSGRRLRAALPSSPVEAARALAAALLPLSEGYPAPYYRLGR